MTSITSIEQKLHQLFSPQKLKIIDESKKHKHHLQNPQRTHTENNTTYPTHLHIYMVSSQFIGLNALSRARKIHKALAEELAGSLHSVSLKLKAPDEVN